MGEPEITLAVVMQRRAVQNRWLSEVWEPLGVVLNHPGGGEVCPLVDEGGIAQWLHPGFKVKLFRDEAEGYYLNVSTREPRVFVMWRMQDGRGQPEFVTLSYNEAGRMMDGGEQVDAVPMPAELFAWVGAYVEANYRPEPKKRRRPQSFLPARDRAGKTS